jgi:hypothetical protein
MLVTGYWRLDAGYSIKKLADQAKTRWYKGRRRKRRGMRYRV